MEVVEFDYSGLNLHFGNLGAKCVEIQDRITALKSETLLKLNLSNNYLSDACTERLLSERHNDTGNVHHLAILDLTNNRITRIGLVTLAPLLISNDFKWLVVSSNDFELDDIRSLYSDLRPLAHKVQEESDVDQLLDNWISKVIWVPESFTEYIHRLPITLSSINSHLKYYGKLRVA